MEEGRSTDPAPPAFVARSPAKAGNSKTKLSLTPTDFWNTPVGRSLGASAVGRIIESSSSGGGGGGGGGGGVDVSRQMETFNPSEREREDAAEEGGGEGHPVTTSGGVNGVASGGVSRQRGDKFNRSEGEDAGEDGGGGGHPVLGSSVDRITSGALPTDRENRRDCDEGASTESASERGVVPASTVTQENSRSDITHRRPVEHMPPSDESNCDAPAEQTVSPAEPTARVETGTILQQDPTESARREGDPTRAEYDALAEERRDNTRPAKVCGADSDEEVREAKRGKCPPAQGTGTQAVRSLSQVPGGRALAEVEGGGSSLVFESASGSACKSLRRSLGEFIG